MTTEIIHGDALTELSKMPPDSVQMCVTSPPYFGLRDYGVTGQIGQEQSVEAYVAALVAVFDQVRRVLKPDGTLWLNLGDSYAANRGGFANGSSDGGVRRGPRGEASVKPPVGLKPKDRMMIPARVALALQADSWWLRDEIVWHKPRTTPSSVKDRTCAAHEMVYLLAKSERYYFDYLAIEEPSKYPGLTRGRKKAFREHEGNASAHRKVAGFYQDHVVVRETRRKRSVWSVSPEPYRDAHFATFPTALIEPCILAGSRPGDVVLDPFFGAGTTGLVASRHGRACIGIELNGDYVALAASRLRLGVFA